MSSSEPNGDSHDRGLDVAVAEYYRQVDCGISVDHQAFMRRYPGLETELGEFFSNIGVVDFGHSSEELSRRDSSPRAASALASDVTLSTAREKRNGDVIHEAVMLRDYRILECIGQGGMGRVHRALHVRLKKEVALKILKIERVNSPEAILRFDREMQCLASLDHANIVKALDAGEYQGIHYFVMELLKGIDLSKLVHRIGPLPVPDASRIICLAADALQCAHDQKILHRDVKPSNLMITSQGNVKLLDLGLAHIFEQPWEDQISRMDQTVGTLAYMAPEQLLNGQQCSNQSDVFSLGISLHELLSGKRPCFQAGSVPLVADVRSVRPDLDKDLAHLLDQMIAHSPEDRPQSMGEVASQLSRFATNADLAGLVSEYYRWNSRGAMVPTPPPICGDTEEVSIAIYRTSDMGRDQETGVQSATHLADKTGKRRSIGYLLTGVAVAAIVASIFQWSRNNNGPVVYPPPPPLEAPVGVLMIVSNADDEISQQIIARGNLRAQPIKEGGEKGELLGVNEGQNDLPAGRYELVIPGPVDYEPMPFEITKAAVTKISPTALLKNAFFQYPVIPVAGKYAAYHGQVWLASWSNSTPTGFDLYLEVLSEDNEATPRTKWLKVEVRCALYQEVAYLKIDADTWATRGQLSIQEGWVEASGASIKQFINARVEDVSQDTLVVKFDSTNDLLKEHANFTLPEGRLSIQDILVLYFGDNRISAANEIITKLRPRLSENGKRHVWLEHIPLDKGMFECYVVSSRSRDQEETDEGWRIARSRENPFEVAELQVKSPFLEAKCTTKASGPVITSADELRETLEDLASRAINPAKLAKAHPFDQATIPDVPSSFFASGTISIGGQAEAIEFSVTMLGTEEVDGKQLHWLELDVRTDPAGADHREAARLLVDASEYPGRLELVRGWLAFDDGSTVLPLATDRKLESVINARMQLAAEPHFKGIGVVDLMWMLFKMDCEPSSRLADLRSLIDGGSQDRVVNFEQKSFTCGKLDCVRHELSTATPTTVEYTIFRCPQVPFGFAAVELKVPTVEINLELKNYQPAVQPMKNSRLGSKEKWESLEQETAERLAKRAERNWRVWTWEISGKTYKVWAEFGGTVNNTKPVRKEVLLWDKSGREARVPVALFIPADQDWINLGREWVHPKNPKQYPRRVVTSVKGDTLEIAEWIKDEKRLEPTGNFDKKNLAPVDREWIDNHVKSTRSQKPDVIEMEDFARYVR